jgi:diaminobutyrate-2-oxoglutarate transaminase
MNIFEEVESEVRSYCRSFPALFARGEGCRLYDQDNVAYLDFFAGAGALNYGHNPPAMKKRLLEYIEGNGITHGLDMATVAKGRFLQKFRDTILQPRNMHYKVQFPGPTGTNAVESALKLARKVTGREKILFFTQAFHGMTLGSLSISGNMFKREGAGLSLTNTTCMPYDGYFGEEIDTIEYIDRMLESTGSGVDLPAAAIVETIQAEGGLNSASRQWLEGLQALCRKYDMLLIVDDIQAGCGRAGTFFSFENMNLEPDVVCLSKSISGYGLPMALCLIRPDLDIWEPGEHNGTFRGNNLAFITATEALHHWESGAFSADILRKGRLAEQRLRELEESFPELIDGVRGRGLLLGIVLRDKDMGSQLSKSCFQSRMLIETSGADSDVLKLLPPLIIDDESLEKGLDIIEDRVSAMAGNVLV